MENKLFIFLSLLFGITIGAMIAVLFTPENGPDNYKKMVDFTKEFAHDFITKGKEGLEASVKKWPN
jgi:gas vesicle protein